MNENIHCDKNEQRTNTFELQEACQLLDQYVLRKTSMPKPEQNIGRVAGVLTVNEDIEVVVKFLNEITQFTKAEFDAELEMLDDDE